MATLNTAHYLLQKQDRANTTRKATANVSSGEIEFAVIPYTLTGSEATNDILNLCLLPAGVVPVPHLSHVVCSADPGTTVEMDIGTADNADGWADGIALSSGGVVACTSGTMPAWVAPTVLEADTAAGSAPQTAKVYATLTSISSATASVVLFFNLAYRRQK